MVADTGRLTFPASLMHNLTAPETGALEIRRVALSSASGPNAYVEIVALMGGAVTMKYVP